jgi:transcriptional regulator with XRE-family HTH domain
MDAQQLFVLNLKRYRTLAGYSQAVLAEKMNSDEGTISRIENFKVKPSFQTIAGIAEALGVFPYALFLKPDLPPYLMKSEQLLSLMADIGAVINRHIELLPDSSPAETAAENLPKGYARSLMKPLHKDNSQE